MCLGATASQTGGSITRPASFCGVCGIKPTYGRICLDGIVPLAPSMDHPGVIAAGVKDLAILFGAISDPYPPFSVQAAISDPEQPPCLGRLGGMFVERAAPEMQSALAVAVRRLQEAGAKVMAIDPPAAFSEVVPQHAVIMAVEAAEVHELRIHKHPEDYPPKITGLIREGLATSATAYVRSLHHKDVLTDSLTEQLELSEAHAFLCPATLGAAPPASTTGDPIFNSPWSYTGLPVISFPIGWTKDGMPLCAQLIGDKFSEEELFRWALWCERAVEFERRMPLAV
jgi:aspartyl-tRNA(Asn)/glutamyl-tRNA(Gln) amidotransferase subunit A